MLELKLPSVTGYCSLFSVVRVLFSLVLSAMTYEVSLRNTVPLRRLILFVKVGIKMKSYYDLMIFSTVCSSFQGFKCVIQQLKDPKKITGSLPDPKKYSKIGETQKIAQKFANTEKHDLRNPKKQLKNLPTQKNRISSPKK